MPLDNATSQGALSANSTLQNEPEIILDFFAGSGTTAHAVMELNRQDGGKRRCILVTNNEFESSKGKYESGITNGKLDENGIALKVTTKRLKRIMSGCCYDGSKDFEWLKKNEPYKDNLEVLQIAKISTKAQEKGQNPLDLIDECAYDLPKFKSIHEKAKWLYDNFKACVKECESDEAYINRHPKKGGEND